MDVVALFGPVVRSGLDGGGYVTNEPVENNYLWTSALAFHSDLAFSPHPVLGISLYAEAVEDDRTSTYFVDATRAYRRLPESKKQALAGLHAPHVFGANLAGPNPEDLPPHLPRHVHPLVMRHPRTGEDILYASLTQTARIVELPKTERDQMVAEILAALYRQDEIYEHRWRKGDLLVWDNLALQHARGDIASVGIRRLRRVASAVAGFEELYPELDSPPAADGGRQAPAGA